MVARGDLLTALDAAESLHARVVSDPLSWIQWLPPQHAFLSHTGKRVALRGPNQALGKTYCGAGELLYRLTGEHPYKPVKPPPIRAWVVCGSHEQARSVQRKVWELVPKHLVADGCYFDPAKGEFHGKYPTLRLTCGSEAVFKSSLGKTVSLASDTLDYVWIDEPPSSSRVYSELVKRVMKKNGDVFLTFTPVNAPVEWIKEACTQGTITDLHYPLKPEYLIPVGSDKPLRLEDGTVCDQAWIDSIIADTLPYERPVVIGGEWEFRLENSVYDQSWRRDVHLTPAPPRGEVKVTLGIDYGDRDNKQCALLLAVDDSEVYPRVWVLDETYSDGTTTIDQDARAILEMLRRNNMTWRSLDHVHGDRIHLGRLAVKSGKQMMRAIATELGIADSALYPRIRTVSKRKSRQHRGFVASGERFLHQAMLRPGHFHVHPRCTRFAECLDKYTGADDDWKDLVDAARYGLHTWIFARVKRSNCPVYLY